MTKETVIDVSQLLDVDYNLYGLVVTYIKGDATSKIASVSRITFFEGKLTITQQLPD